MLVVKYNIYCMDSIESKIAKIEKASVRNDDKKDTIVILGEWNLLLIDQDKYDEFYSILVETDFEEFCKVIYFMLYQIKYSEVKILEEEYRRDSREYFKERLEVAETFLLFKQNKSGISISNAKNTKKLSAGLNRYIEESLEKHFKDLVFDSEERALLGGIDTEQIKNKIAELESRLKANIRRGAPIKNEKMKSAVAVFLACKEKLRSDDFYAIYECCDYFNLINGSRNDYSRNYIAAVCKQSEKYNFWLRFPDLKGLFRFGDLKEMIKMVNGSSMQAK